MAQHVPILTGPYGPTCRANVPGQHDPLKNHAGPAHSRQISGPTQLARGLMGRVGHLFALHGPAQLGTIFKWVVLV